MGANKNRKKKNYISFYQTPIVTNEILISFLILFYENIIIVIIVLV